MAVSMFINLEQLDYIESGELNMGTASLTC